MKGKQTEEEDRRVGTVSWPVVRAYIASFGSPRTWMVFALATLGLHGFGSMTQIWVALWTADANSNADGVSKNNTYYIVGYVLISVLCTSADGATASAPPPPPPPTGCYHMTLTVWTCVVCSLHCDAYSQRDMVQWGLCSIKAPP